MKNDYQIIFEKKKYYAVFTDGEGKHQKVEVDKEVANTIIKEQQAESAMVRMNERNTISLDSLDYEGEVFATYDEYQLEKEFTQSERIEKALKQMEPEQAALLRLVFFEGLTHQKIAEIKGVSRQAISQQIKTAKKIFKKIYEKPCI